ncbi:T9SS type A sorting domain-containing protein [Dyadobacter sp.]|uniref:T9SS type A sorting domain-containing protein n=1 Tax=Dyadobacter sp. TaxID=1914288 RepID=UPI003F711C19
MKKLLSFILLLSSLNTYSQTLEQDRLALVAFFNAADGERWFFQQRPSDYPAWQVPGNPGDSPCGWYGVECENNRVVSLSLVGEDVSGTIPGEFGNLTALKSLILPGGGFFQQTRPTLHGELPLEFANLVNLETLDLTNNFFDQTNSQVLFSLPNLKSLSFSATWQIPSSIGNLSKLETLVIDNRGTNGARANVGAFPAEVGNLTNLASLSIYSTSFAGTIPAEIGNLANLTSLTMDAPVTVGTIPSAIGNLGSLKLLSLSNMQGVGAIPTSIGNLSNLTSLKFSDFTGTQSIPAAIRNLANLTSLAMDNLAGAGPIPSEIGSMINLTSLSITGLGNAGPIPSEIGNLINLEELHLEENGHTGTIPASFNKLTNAFRIYLSKNNLTSPIPSLGALRTRRIFISENNFTFEGLETSENRFAGYAYQKKIPVTKSNGMLSVNAGGTLSKNTYKWYNFGSLVETKVGDSTFTPAETGNYHVEVTNSVATGLTLISENVESSLPVTLIYFRGKQEKTSNVISWKTASETSNKGFEIEKSQDSRTFERVGFIDGGGDTREDRSYRYIDHTPFGVTYYRLKQLDYDGRSDYSKIIMVKNEPELSVYPNPARDYITVSGLSTHDELSIFNMRGELVLKQQSGILKPVNVSGLPVGIYTLKIGDRIKNIAISK